jgi:hypothetical protein
MAISYLDPIGKKIVRQPLVKRFRSYYRSPRKSGIENLFNDKMYMDINRVYLELEILNTSILDKVKIFLGLEKDNTHEIVNNPESEYYGRVYDLSNDSVSFYDFDLDSTIEYTETMDTIGGNLSKLFYKVNKLEKQTG